jgi:hypothetical protein
MLRSRRNIRLVAIVVLSLALVVPRFVSSPLVQAAPILTVSKTAGYVGDQLTASVRGFPKYRTVTFFWDGKALGSMRSSNTGEGFLVFGVPVAKKGAHEISATSSSVTASTTFTVKPRLRLDPTVTTVGSTMTATLRGFARAEVVDIALDSTSKMLLTVTVSGSGSATVNLTIPAMVVGTHKLIGTGNAQSATSATFKIIPSVTISPVSGSPGTTVRALVRGFAKGQRIEVQWIDSISRSLAIVTTSGTGSANVNVTVPINAVPGSYTIRVVSDDVNVAQTPFEVT